MSITVSVCKLPVRTPFQIDKFKAYNMTIPRVDSQYHLTKVGCIDNILSFILIPI